MTDVISGFTPLSPPTSPHMSAYSADPAGSEWHTGKVLEQGPSSPADSMALMHVDAQRPMLRTHKSFPYTLRTSGAGVHGTTTPDSSGASQVSHTERIQISNIEEIEATGAELATVTYGGSAPASPVSRLTPPSPIGVKTEEGQDLVEDDTMLSDCEGQDDQKPAMTAAELRAQKRKMKRFRCELRCMNMDALEGVTDGGNLG